VIHVNNVCVISGTVELSDMQEICLSMVYHISVKMLHIGVKLLCINIIPRNKQVMTFSRIKDIPRNKQVMTIFK
jgi:hypothetical protein